MTVETGINLKKHWNRKYEKTPDEKLGWYETDFSKTFELINKTGLDKNAKILVAGAGTTGLIDELIKNGFSNIIATDISETALNRLKQRTGNNEKTEFITDDLTNPRFINKIKDVDLWIDRAVLHFFTEEKDKQTYFSLMNNSVKNGGYAVLIQFNSDGAETCSGLPVCRYNKKMLSEKAGKKFKIIESFNHIYTMPSGDKRPYIYTLFRKIKD